MKQYKIKIVRAAKKYLEKKIPVNEDCLVEDLASRDEESGFVFMSGYR